MLYAHIWLYTGVGHCIVYSDLGFTTTFYLVNEINLTLSLFIITAHSRLVGKPKTYSIMVSFQTALENFFKKGFTFSGRATRAEYWWWALFQFQISIDIMFFGSLLANLFVGGVSGYGILFVHIPLLIWNLLTFIPNLALTIRRLHDAKYSGWWLLWSLFPVVGAIVLFMASISPSDTDNQYGPNPFND